MVRPERFELPAYCSGGNRSIQLSYGRTAVILHEGLNGAVLDREGCGLSCCVALAFELGHGGLDKLLGPVYLIEDGLQIERGLGGMAMGDAIDAVLTKENEGVSEHVERDGETAALGTEHELMLLQRIAVFG